MNNRFWFIAYLVLVILMSFYTIKLNIGFEVRISQIYLLIIFLLILLYELRYKVFNLRLYSFFLLSGILLSLISLNSAFEKIGEFKFIIKYVVIFPAAFYVGYRAIYLVGIRNIIKISEIAILLATSLAIFLYYYPIKFLIHDRGALTGLQGTFWESAGLSIYVSIFLLISLILRIYYNNITKKIFYLYAIAFVIIILTKTKIVYIAFLTLIIIAVIYKLNFIIKSNFLNNFALNFIRKVNIKKIALFTGMFLFILYTYNQYEPFITEEIIKDKIENERGRALKVSFDLLEKSNWLGAYGFGFVERYFSGIYRGENIIGLGEGINAIFNSFLDIWIAVGLFGVIFQIIILVMAFGKKHFLNIAIPVFLFLVGLTGPVFIDFNYYLFLGLSYGFKKYMENKVENV